MILISGASGTSASDGVGLSDGVYSGSVSTESDPRCLRTVRMGTRGAISAVTCTTGGLAICGGSATRSVQSSGEIYESVDNVPRERYPAALSLMSPMSSQRIGNSFRHQQKVITSKKKQTDRPGAALRESVNHLSERLEIRSKTHLAFHTLLR